MPANSDKQANVTEHVNDEMEMGPIQKYRQAMGAFSPSLRRLLLTMALIYIPGLGLIPVLQNLYRLRLGFDVQFIGLLVGLGQVVWAAAALPAGLLSNRIGLRNGLMLGIGLFGLGLALLLLVESRPESQWQAWLMGSQVVFWLGTALITVNVAPYVMAVTGEGERRYAFATFSATLPAMALVGSLVAGVLPGLLAGWLDLTLDQPAPYRLALWLGPVLSFGTLAILVRADPVHAARQYARQGRTARAPLALLAFFGLVVFLGAIGEGTVRIFFNVYLDMALGVAPAAIGSIMGLAQLLPIGAALAVPFLVARWGTGSALAASLLGAGLLFLPLAAVPLVWVTAVAYMGIIALVTLTATTRDMFGQELVLPRWRTSSQGVVVVGLALGWSLAGIAGGALITVSGFTALYCAGALAALLAAGLLAGYLRWAGIRPAAALE
ncbi:MAG: MFS transporter [Caldilineaceae bacterium]|nr:MFS transporter [Caldilineaceae bacterium]